MVVLDVGFYAKNNSGAVLFRKRRRRSSPPLARAGPVLNYQLSPAPGPAGKMQAERVNTHNGANIYDAATWQIAVMLGFVKNKFNLSSRTNPYALASNLNEVLQQSGAQAACDTAAHPGANRGGVWLVL